MSLTQNVKATIHSLLQQCGVQYKALPFDQVLYQECFDEGVRRGYPMEGEVSVRTYLRDGVMYGATAGGHLHHRPTQIWISLWTSCAIFVDETFSRFPSEVAHTYQFNDRFIRRQAQGNGVLGALADLLHQTPELFNAVASNLVTTSILNFVTACLLEHETRDMKISTDAQRYPTYQRIMSGVGEAYSFMVFDKEIPLNDYIQALPEMTLFIHNLNDVLSFYKEERAGESGNQVSLIAARKQTSKLEAFNGLAEITVELHGRILKIMEASPAACEAFRQYTAGYVYFHTSLQRYRLLDLEL
ncbi:hypothetical protein HYDPIDRAFT_170274 [Hydnomerulius pinastri MD-312]|uniref:Terpenoid synthase n=1 Tax=Hydnomerulius pinastri MD-312 TaxID=994086 RepID=A0A0C9WAA1_9AGAM|nr:hypothetical protein HYDPIDRAFT_170274 [Hydnomerulius pinastri MD-312]